MLQPQIIFLFLAPKFLAKKPIPPRQELWEDPSLGNLTNPKDQGRMEGCKSVSYQFGRVYCIAIIMKTKTANTIRGRITKKNTRSPSLKAALFSREKEFILMIIKLEVNLY